MSTSCQRTLFRQRRWTETLRWLNGSSSQRSLRERGEGESRYFGQGGVQHWSRSLPWKEEEGEFCEAYYRGKGEELATLFSEAEVVVRVWRDHREILGPEGGEGVKREYGETLKLTHPRKPWAEYTAYSSQERGVAYAAAAEAFKVLLAEREPRPLPKGPRDFLFEGRGAGIFFHEILGHLLEADTALYPGSPFRLERIGERLFPEGLGVVDLADGLGVQDDEGTPSQRVVLVEGGVLRGFVSDKKHLLLGFPQGGRGRRESYRFPPLPRQNIISVEPGRKERRQILEESSGAVWIKNLRSGLMDRRSLTFELQITEAYLLGKNVSETTLLRPFSIRAHLGSFLGRISDLSREVYAGGREGICMKSGQMVRIGYRVPLVKVRGVEP